MKNKGKVQLRVGDDSSGDESELKDDSSEEEVKNDKDSNDPIHLDDAKLNKLLAAPEREDKKPDEEDEDAEENRELNKYEKIIQSGYFTLLSLTMILGNTVVLAMENYKNTPIQD